LVTLNARRDAFFMHFAVAINREGGAVRAVLVNGLGDLFGIVDFGAVDREDHVRLLKAGFFEWRVFFDSADERAPFSEMRIVRAHGCRRGHSFKMAADPWPLENRRRLSLFLVRATAEQGGAKSGENNIFHSD
jgi:hypothetical protein